MHHTLSATLAGSRERELRSVARRPEHLMSRELELAADGRPGRRALRTLRHSLRSPRERES